MKNIRFRKLILLSYFEKLARIINLDSDLVLIRGENRTGKSCVIKSLYQTLGAVIKTNAYQWENANVISLLFFTVDKVPLLAMLIGPEIILYRGDGIELFRMRHHSKGSNEFASWLGITINNSKNNESKETLTPGALFMPFYIDQDDGWSEPWSSFSRIGSASARRNAILLHNGLINDNYFVAKMQLDDAEAKLRSLRAKIDSQQAFSKDIKKKFCDVQFPASGDEFKSEIKAFIEKLQGLKDRQKEILKELQAFHSKRCYCVFQLEQLHNNIKEIEKDFKYALDQSDMIACPTCGALYCNSLMNRHNLVADISECKDLIIKYNRERIEVEDCIDRINQEAETINDTIIETQKIIDTKKNQYTLKDYIEAQKTIALKETMNSMADEYREEKNELDAQVINLTSKVNFASEMDNKKDALLLFRESVVRSLRAMGSHIENSEKIRFGWKINMTGSILPQAIVAYNFAYYEVMRRYNCPIFCPIVIDEPHQKGLADNGFNKLLEYVINNRPQDSQLILSVANDSSIDKSNMLIVDMDKFGRVLIKEDYDTAREEIESLLNQNFMMIME